MRPVHDNNKNNYKSVKETFQPAARWLWEYVSGCLGSGMTLKESFSGCDKALMVQTPPEARNFFPGKLC